MTDALALAVPGLWALVAVTLVAGIVYGFAGFGAALIFMPVASALLPVPMAIAAFSLTSLASLVTVVPRAWGEVNRRAVLWMIAAATPAAILGIWVLRFSDAEAIRWAVISIAAVTLAALVMGWRYRTEPKLRVRVTVGAAAGFVGGATGLNGPVLVLFQLAGNDSVARSRALTIIFLTITSILFLPLMAMQGLLTSEAVALGLLLLVPYGLGTRIGQAMFRPSAEGLYRWTAYAIIGAAILLGLPIWS